jgi:ribosomal protein L35
MYPIFTLGGSGLARVGSRHGSRKAGAVGVKTKSSIKKRFRVNGVGVLKRMRSGKRHLNFQKSSARIRRLGLHVPIKAKGLRKSYLRVFGLSPFKK